MLVKLLVGRASLSGPQNIGDEIEVSADEAARMIAAGQCVPVRSNQPERAVKRARKEKAVK